jgi:hypothetical protein
MLVKGVELDKTCSTVLKSSINTETEAHLNRSLFNNSVHTANKKCFSITITNINWLML